jgi:nicotinic acetylcholine receptor
MRRRILYYLINILFPCLLLSAISVMTFWLPPDSGEKVALSITVLLAFSVFMLLIAENIPTTSETVPLIGIYLTVVMVLTSLSIALAIFILELHHATKYAPRASRKFYNYLTKKLAPRIGLQDVIFRFEISQTNSAIRAKMCAEELDNSHEESTVSSARMRIASRRYQPLVFGGRESPLHYSYMNLHRTEAALRSPAEERLSQKKQLAENDDNISQIISEWKLIALIIDRLLFRVFATLTVVSSVVLLVVIPVLKNANVISRSEDTF